MPPAEVEIKLVDHRDRSAFEQIFMLLPTGVICHCTWEYAINSIIRIPQEMKDSCSCSASYIGETGFTLSHRLLQHMKHLTRYNNAKLELEQGSSTTRHRGKPTSVPTHVAMQRALAASAVAEHAALCSGSLQTRVLCIEPQWSLRRMKEALFIQHNANIRTKENMEELPTSTAKGKETETLPPTKKARLQDAKTLREANKGNQRRQPLTISSSNDLLRQKHEYTVNQTRSNKDSKTAIRQSKNQQKKIEENFREKVCTVEHAPLELPMKWDLRIMVR
ncbi:hypothetical protein M514_15891 [Trichuris suis]|uniref:Uncharacterized protein n=1 Tax=Trichuris suis TaxID=68888 RepID=A0A085NQN5_9BILA|nr:hypothetical protein M514_15891 [Trichuris suis]